MELLTEAGVPPGVVNMVNGRGDVTGDALVRHPLVNVVSFTGGTHTGRMIAAAASPQLKRVDLELGGKSANIITASADLDAALDGALSAIYTNNGQQCFAGSRILVQREIADAFIGAFVERARSIRVGSPDDPDTELGPLANAQHYARVMSFVETAKAEGARILTGGQRPAHCPKGYYIEPTAVLWTRIKVDFARKKSSGHLRQFRSSTHLTKQSALPTTRRSAWFRTCGPPTWNSVCEPAMRSRRVWCWSIRRCCLTCASLLVGSRIRGWAAKVRWMRISIPKRRRSRLPCAGPTWSGLAHKARVPGAVIARCLAPGIGRVGSMYRGPSGLGLPISIPTTCPLGPRRCAA